MTLSLSLALPGARAPSSTPAIGPDSLTAVEVLGDANYTVLTAASAHPAGLATALVPTNGWVLRITTDTGIAANAPTTFDATKVSVTVTDPGWDTSGAAATVGRTVTGMALQHYPWPDEATIYQQASGVYDVILDQQLYNSALTDTTARTYRSTIVQIDLAAGYLPGRPAARWTGSITRSDSRNYPLPKWKRIDPICRPYSASLQSEWVVVDDRARAGQQVACVESWMFDGTTEGSVSRSGSMVLATNTGPSCASGFSAYVYRTNAPSAGLADGTIYERSRIKPWFGPARDSTDLGDDVTVVFTPNLLKGYPEYKDAAGTHSPIYAWIDAAGVGGGVPAVQTSSADPGSVAYYASFAAARTALQTFNNGRGHNDMSGSVFVLPGLSQIGAGVGSNLAAYNNVSTWDRTVSGTPGGLIMPIVLGIPIAGDLATVRIRPKNQAGVAPSSTLVYRQLHWKNVYFDNSGDGNTVVSMSNTFGNSGSSNSLSAQGFAFATNCRFSSTSTGGMSGASGLWNVLVDDYASSGGDWSNAAGLWVSVGVRAINASCDKSKPGLCIVGSWWDGGIVTKQTSNTSTPTIRSGILAYSRFDFTNPVSGAILTPVPAQFGGAHDIGLGWSLVLLRYISGSGGNWGGIANDGFNQFFVENCFQHVCTAIGTAASNGRVNMFYNDNGYILSRKECVMRFCAWGRNATKNGTFAAPETPSSKLAATYSAVVAYAAGTPVQDGAGVMYQAIRDVPAGTALSDATYWYAPGSIWTFTHAYSQQSQRTGNARFRAGVENWGNVSAGSTQGVASDNDPTFSNSFLSDLIWPRSGIAVGDGSKWGHGDTTQMFVDDTAAVGSRITSRGDYRAKVGGDLVNQVPAGFAVSPGDVFGKALANDGTDCAGWAGTP